MSLNKAPNIFSDSLAMKLLIVSNHLSKDEKFRKALIRHNIDATHLEYNALFSSSSLKEFSYSAAVLIVNSTLEMKQFMIALRRQSLKIPTILLWGATRTIPRSMQEKCDHHLTQTESHGNTIQRIKEIVYSYTVNDLYTHDLDVIQFGELLLDRRYRTLQYKNQTLQLRNKEFALLEFFMLHPQRLLCRNTILESVWDINKTFKTNTVDVHIGKLRKLLGDQGKLIQTVHSIGYIFG